MPDERRGLPRPSPFLLGRAHPGKNAINTGQGELVMPAKKVGRAVNIAAKAVVGKMGTRVIERVVSAAGRASTKPIVRKVVRKALSGNMAKAHPSSLRRKRR